MSTSSVTDNNQTACPVCGEPMRREFDGVRNPPMPHVFWFCINPKCDDGNRNKIFRELSRKFLEQRKSLESFLSRSLPGLNRNFRKLELLKRVFGTS